MVDKIGAPMAGKVIPGNPNSVPKPKTTNTPMAGKVIPGNPNSVPKPKTTNPPMAGKVAPKKSGGKTCAIVTAALALLTLGIICIDKHNRNNNK